jgi:hypothetical protein
MSGDWRNERIREALEAVIEAARAYLPPDGVTKDEFIFRVLKAIDNPSINAALADASAQLVPSSPGSQLASEDDQD